MSLIIIIYKHFIYFEIVIYVCVCMCVYYCYFTKKYQTMLIQNNTILIELKNALYTISINPNINRITIYILTF